MPLSYYVIKSTKRTLISYLSARNSLLLDIGLLYNKQFIFLFSLVFYKQRQYALSLAFLIQSLLATCLRASTHKHNTTSRGKNVSFSHAGVQWERYLGMSGGPKMVQRSGWRPTLHLPYLVLHSGTRLLYFYLQGARK